jgi:hypothetical protein
MRVQDNALNLNQQKTKYRALDDWFLTPQGRDVGASFAARLALVSEYVQGSRVLQLGACGHNAWLQELHLRRQWVASPCLDADASVITALNALPLDRRCVDCVVAPFALEAFGWDKNPLDEIDRILSPMGHVIFLGINPLSLWGLALRLGYLHDLGVHATALVSPLLLQQSLLRRGYRQCRLESFYYIPPLYNNAWIKRLAFLNEMGKMLALTPAGFYCLIMQKYQVCPPNAMRRAKARRSIALSPTPAWARLNPN